VASWFETEELATGDEVLNSPPSTRIARGGEKVIVRRRSCAVSMDEVPRQATF
jgi:hypothetical protein